MEEHDASPTSPHGNHGSTGWFAALIVSACLLFLVLGGVYALRNQLLDALREDGQAQTAERQKLAQRIETLEQSLDALHNQPKAEDDALANKLSETTHTLEGLSTRLDSLEKKVSELPPPAAPAPASSSAAPTTSDTHPSAETPEGSVAALLRAANSGKPFTAEWEAFFAAHATKATTLTHLASAASHGIPSEAALRNALRETLQTALPAPRVEDTSFAGKLNSHLGGLISIKRSGEDRLIALHQAAESSPLESLAEKAAALDLKDSALRQSLADWQQDVENRREALKELTSLGGI